MIYLVWAQSTLTFNSLVRMKTQEKDCNSIQRIKVRITVRKALEGLLEIILPLAKHEFSRKVQAEEKAIS